MHLINLCKFILECLILSEWNFKGFFYEEKNNLTADKKEKLPLPDSVEGEKSSIWGHLFLFYHTQIFTHLTKNFAIWGKSDYIYIFTFSHLSWKDNQLHVLSKQWHHFQVLLA